MAGGSGRWRRRTGWPWWLWALAVLGGLVVLAGVVVLIWPVPTLFYSYVPDPKDRSAAEATTRTGMLAGLAGLAALGTFWLNSRVYQVTARTFEITEQGHITDRYTKAITQLGDDKLDIRLGGIYALERLAVDSKRDHPTVVEVLSAFIRERSGAARTPRRRPAGRKTAHPPSLTFKRTKQVTTDVQAALAVLGRLPVRDKASRGDLAGADLSGVALAWAADLSRTRLVGTDLTGAILQGANLTSANLFWANLTGADLTSADLTSAGLPGANLAGADLHNTNLTEGVLIGANLTGAVLSRADLTGTYLDGADLTGVLGLTGDQIALARGTAETRLPENMPRPKAWEPATGT